MNLFYYYIKNKKKYIMKIIIKFKIFIFLYYFIINLFRLIIFLFRNIFLIIKKEYFNKKRLIY